MSQSKQNRRSTRLVIGLGVLAVIALFLFGVVIKAVTEIAGNLRTAQTTTTGAPTTSTTKRAEQLILDEMLSCSGAIVFDSDVEQSVLEQRADIRCYPASLTKLLTALTALEYVSPTDVFTVGDELKLLQPHSSVAGLKTGNVLTMEMLLDAMLVPSGNDAAYTVAVGVARKRFGEELTPAEAVTRFAEMMNEQAQKLGMTDSHFSVPDGYYREDHYSTPRDLLALARAAMNQPLVSASMQKPSARCVMVSGQDITWVSTNPLIQKGNPYYMPEAVGGKTGYTTEGGYCAAVVGQKDGKTITAVLVGAPTNDDRWQDAVILLKNGLGLTGE